MKRLPHLLGAMRLRNEHNQGLCIHRSAGFVLDTPGSNLFFGVFRAASPEEREDDPHASPEPFIHCWAEYQGAVYAPTTIERMGGKLVPYDRVEYYAVNGITNIHSISRPKLLRISAEIGLSAHLRLGRPTRNQVSVGGTLLDAAGMPYRVNSKGGVLPI